MASTAAPRSGFVPPPYPHDRLATLRRLADALPGGVVDCSVGTPVLPMPELALEALRGAAPGSTGYAPSIGTPALRDAAARWIGRRFGVSVTSEDVIACVGTKEFVASLPHYLFLRDPSRAPPALPPVASPPPAIG